MAFRFSLEPVRRHRKRLEEVAQRNLMEAQATLQKCLAEIESMYRRNDEVRVEIFEAQSRGSRGDIESVRQMEHFLVGQRQKIMAKRAEARQLMQVEEQMHDKLIEATKERKVMDRLREQKLKAYREQFAKLEAKELDDINVMRQRWRNS